jgi:NADH:ubiquinone oxidoreductase subunit K
MVLNDFFVSYIVSIHQILILASATYFISISGVIYNHRNFLVTMLFLEVMYVSIFIYFNIASLYLNLPIGQIYALALLITVTCESAVGLGVLISIYRNNRTIE